MNIFYESTIKNSVCATIVATQWGFAAVSAHGRGSGGILDPLQSQGSLVLSQDGSFLFAANAGSGTISSFRVRPYGLDFVGEVHSGGEGPISIATHGDLLYTLNIANITGFCILPDGTLRAVPLSTRFLDAVGGEISAIPTSLLIRTDRFRVAAGRARD